jgi:hypothetical protein
MIEALSVFGLTLDLIKNLKSSAKQSSDDKRTYEQKLETARGVEIYKYVLLINISALEGYVAQARLQAQQSFNLSRFVAIVGFLIVSVAIGLSVYLTAKGNSNLSAAYLTGVAGVFTEFISGVFFFLYSKTLAQINLFHDKLVDMQKTSLSHLAEMDYTETSATPGSIESPVGLPLSGKREIQPAATSKPDNAIP